MNRSLLSFWRKATKKKCHSEYGGMPEKFASSSIELRTASLDRPESNHRKFQINSELNLKTDDLGGLSLKSSVRPVNANVLRKISKRSGVQKFKDKTFNHLGNLEKETISRSPLRLKKKWQYPPQNSGSVRWSKELRKVIGPTKKNEAMELPDTHSSNIEINGSTHSCTYIERLKVGNLHLNCPAPEASTLSDISHEMSDPGFYKSLARAVYYDRLTKLLEKHKKGRWDANFVNKKLDEYKGLYHRMYRKACMQYGETPGPEFIARHEHNIGTWDFDESSAQLCLYEFKRERYDWIMYSRDRVQDLFNIVESIRKQKQRLVLRFIDLDLNIYQPIKFTIVRERKVAARKHGSCYRWKHKDKGELKAEVKIILYPYDKILKLDWITIKEFEMTGTQVIQLLKTFCDYLQFTMILNDSSGGTRASSIIRKGVSWYQTLGFVYNSDITKMFETVLEEWGDIKMITTRGEPKSLMDALQEKKFISNLYCLNGKRLPDWMKEIYWRQCEKSPRCSHQDNSHKRLLKNEMRKTLALSEISILEFTKKVYHTFSFCRSIEKEYKSKKALSGKETEQLQNVKRHIKDLANRMEAYLRKNPKTKKGYEQLYEKEHRMNRKCTRISEQAFLTSTSVKIEIPTHSQTDANTINSRELDENKKKNKAAKLNTMMMIRNDEKKRKEKLAKSNSSKLVKKVENHESSQQNEDPTLAIRINLDEALAAMLGDGDFDFEESDEILEMDWQKPRVMEQKTAPHAQFPDTDSELSESTFHQHARSLSHESFVASRDSSALFSQLSLHEEVGSYRAKLLAMRTHMANHKLPWDELSRLTPLMWAIIFKNKDVFNRLLNDKATNLNETDAEGRTALFAACTLGEEDTVKKLLASGATPSARSLSGKDACEYAEICEKWKVVAVFHSHSLDTVISVGYV